MKTLLLIYLIFFAALLQNCAEEKPSSAQKDKGSSVAKLEMQFLPHPNVIYKLEDDLGFENINFGVSLGALSLAQIDSLHLIFSAKSIKQLSQSYPRSLLEHFIRGDSENLVLNNLHYLFPKDINIDHLHIKFFTQKNQVLHDSIALTRYSQKNTYQLPFNGTWFLSSGHDFGVEHRRHLSRGHFAWDFVRINERGETSSGKHLEEYFTFGQPVISPANGVVIAMHDEESDNTPGRSKNKKPNFVEIDHGGGEISRIVHLKNGSIMVTAGDRVKSGQKIAEVGNSGYSETPHLHIGFQQQIPDRKGEMRAVPIPVQFSNYRVSWNQGVDQPVSSGRPRRGQFLKNGDERSKNKERAIEE